MSRPYTVAVVAMTPGRVIGHRGQLPWHLPEDLRFFRKVTLGQAVLMGRKTWESIGRPLPGRRNIVLSRNLERAPEGAELIRTPEAIDALGISTRLCVIGGAEIYRLLLPRCDEVLVSLLKREYEGDTWLPAFEDGFEPPEILEEHAEFQVLRHPARKSR
jgi:dihydrofolate reductase